MPISNKAQNDNSRRQEVSGKVKSRALGLVAKNNQAFDPLSIPAKNLRNEKLFSGPASLKNPKGLTKVAMTESIEAAVVLLSPLK